MITGYLAELLRQRYFNLSIRYISFDFLGRLMYATLLAISKQTFIK